LDYEQGSFSVGTWVADVDEGLEIDLYGGFGFDLTEDFSAGIGFTFYQYTGDFDSEYNEVNLSLGFNMLSVGYSIGTHSEDLGLDITESDYTFLEVTMEYESFYGTFGSHGDDFDGDYVEVGYGTEVGGFDVGVAVIFASDELVNDDVKAGGDESIVFSIGKSFDL
jgi:hypothetical protein